MFKNLFSFDDNLGLTQQEYDEAIDGLLEKGIIESKIVDGELCYALTSSGLAVRKHSFSDPKTRN